MRPKAAICRLVFGVDAPSHHERARQFMPRVKEGHGSTVDTRAGGVDVVDEKNTLGRAFLRDRVSVTSGSVKSEITRSSAQQRSDRHLEFKVSHDGLKRVWRRPIRRRHHNDAVDRRPGNYPFAVVVEEAGEESLDNVAVFGDVWLTPIDPTFVASQPLT
jgi:hypothetical protein